MIFRLPLYLKRPSNIIFSMLKTQLKYTVTDRNEKQLIYYRLFLFDRQYYLAMQERLWNDYLEIGLQQNIWPVR